MTKEELHLIFNATKRTYQHAIDLAEKQILTCKSEPEKQALRDLQTEIARWVPDEMKMP